VALRCSSFFVCYHNRVITQASIERVRNEASIVEVVSETVKLRRSGANYTGLCPFHSERSPSFFVREHANSYHCFGCNASGDAISFVMATRAMSFPDAIEFLAGRFGIELTYTESKSTGPRIDREQLFGLCQVAQSFFRRSLLQVKGGKGEYLKVGEYLKKRGLSAEAINTFGIGYCPNQRGVLIDLLTKAGYDKETMLLSGLVRRSAAGELYELFRGRLLFPIFVDAKRIAGFGGRVVPGVMEPAYEKQSPKYVNSPETPLYQKSKTFYGLPQAMQSIRELGEVYIVEGYMDVVGLAMRGVKNVVACCGTALTEQHLKRLSGVCGKVHLLFDGDEAGQGAAAKSFAVARNAELDVTACFLPDEVDPDDFAREHGDQTGEALKKLPKALLIDVFVDGLLRASGTKPGELPGPNLLGKVCDEVAKALKGIQREVVLASLISRAAKKLRIENVQLERLITSDRKVVGTTVRGEQAGAPTETHPVRDHGGVQEKGTKNNFPLRPPGQLPKSDVDLLRVVMVLRSEVVHDVINNTDVCEMLGPEAMGFILGLRDIVTQSDVDEDAQKTKIKEYLQSLGPDWVSLWREAFAIQAKSEEGVRETYQKTLQGFKRAKLQRLLKECQQEVVEYADNPQRQAEVFEQMRSLKSQLDTMVRG
jgi:DNA primase